ncbi:MAG: AzlD family protein [Rhizobiaceae bacterium]|jgi:uncharacterized membrane protein|nr:AzlD family protein [Rhizobiaceae bacterium]
MSDNVWIILAAAVVTYLTRAGGFWVLSRFERIHPRVEAGLNAVPAAVLTTLVAPQMAAGGIPEWAAFAAAATIGTRFGMVAGFMTGWAVVIALRAMV